MKKVFIKYDPYEMKSTVVVDGKEIQKNTHCDSNLKKYLDGDIHIPIQSWIDPINRDNWGGLLNCLCDMGDKDIIIEFSGRKVDYEDVQTSLKAQNESRKLGAKLTFSDLVDEIAPDSEMKKNVDKAVNLMLTDQFKDIVNNSKSNELIAKYNRLQKTYEEIDSQEFRIVFTGTYSSGKSSTINSIIGKNLLPTASGTCTAKICRIIHNADMNNLASVRYDYNGSEKVFDCETAEEVQDIIRAVEDSVDGIEVYTDLMSLYPENIQSDFKIVIIDTPGTDSATGNDTEKFEVDVKRLSKKSHIEITKDILRSKQKEMVVLISDEKFEGENIVDLLDIIEESAGSDEGSFNDRFLFVMNRCDSLSYSNPGETLENYVKNFITNLKKVPHSNRVRNIVNPRVFPITSGAALAVVNGYVDEPDLGEQVTKKAELYEYYANFCKKIYHYSHEKLEGNFKMYIEDIKNRHSNYHHYCLEKHSSVSEATKYKYNQMLLGDLSVAERVLIHSGVPALKDAIQDYIKSYAYPIKVRRLLDCFKDILEELISLNNTEKEELNKAKKSHSDIEFAKGEKEKEKVQEEKRQAAIVRVKEKMENVKNEIDEISEEVTEINGIRSSFHKIKNSISAKVKNRKQVIKSEADKIIKEMSEESERLAAEIRDTVLKIKKKKNTETDNLYNEFTSYVRELDELGLMKNGVFPLKDTVAYKNIIDKNSFIEAAEETREEENPDKPDFGDSILAPFQSFFYDIGSWMGLNKVKVIYTDIHEYVNCNFNLIEAEVDKYIVEIKANYKKDIQSLKKNSKDRVDSVLNLITEVDKSISEIRKKAEELASSKSKYSEQIKKIEDTRSYLESLISLITYTQI